MQRLKDYRGSGFLLMGGRELAVKYDFSVWGDSKRRTTEGKIEGLSFADWMTFFTSSGAQLRLSNGIEVDVVAYGGSGSDEMQIFVNTPLL